MIINLWNTIFYEPLYNALVFLIALSPGASLAVAVIVLTLLVKLVLAPLSYKTFVGQMKQKELQPLIQDIKKKYKDQAEQSKQIFALYKKHNANPFSGCLTLLLQFPVIIGLYQVFLKGVEASQEKMYSFISLPENIHYFFIGIDLHEKSILLAVFAGIFQFIQMYLSPAMKQSRQPEGAVLSDQERISASLQNNMKYMMPFMVGFFAAVVPAAVALYWTVNNIFMIIQEMVVWKRYQKKIS
jgi:YidC/Oxa1 family membrane protein insertase